MRKGIISAAAAAAMALSCSQDTCNENILWYASPAAVWEEALPQARSDIFLLVFGRQAADVFLETGGEV